jgi:flavin-dependent dehydrogenase
MSRRATPVFRRPGPTASIERLGEIPSHRPLLGFPDSARMRYTHTCRHIHLMTNNFSQIDVTVVGGGLAGMAAAFHLAKAGLRVLCIEADTEKRDAVGESLDWSAPELLAALGLPMARLLNEEMATYKRHVILRLRSGVSERYEPGEWLARPPFNVELRTIHVDRAKLDGALRQIVTAAGVTWLRDKVVRVERSNRTVTSVVTQGGAEISSRWFLDASGSGANLFPRLFGLPADVFGPKKVAMWDYFPAPEPLEGTTLSADCEGPFYMSWVWQIPISLKTISVGYVAAGETVGAKRKQGMSLQDIFREQLDQFPEMKQLAQTSTEVSPRTTSFRCRAYAKTNGPNWLVIGESAAMVDPMTANGVTAALRHAEEASRIIVRSRNRKQLLWLPRSLYSWRVRYMANFFNSGIEKVVYDWPVRNRIGPIKAGDVYTIPAWSVNNIYSRIRPSGATSTILFGMFLGTLRFAMNLFYWYCARSRSASPACATS